MIFVGENRSPTAKARGWRWEDGRLAARTLFDALAEIAIDPTEQTFVNLFTDATHAWVTNPHTVRRLRATNDPIVALGQHVSERLTELGITHTMIVHPAARGKIRKRELYRAHVREALAG